jgi:methylenetetrahydrofolate dehydrogenase (NADP+)/methenyltetrahydrofolate cyclohydrolase
MPRSGLAQRSNSNSRPPRRRTNCSHTFSALNNDPAIHGILVQSPPPKHIDEAAIVRAIDPAKDVDGFHPVNVAKLALEDPTGFVPCTPLGCQRLLIDAGIETSGAHAVVVGRSMIVGKPMALLLMAKGKGGDATVTVTHSRTRDLSAITRTADIIIAAIGRPHFIKAEHVKEGAVVIDVGINRSRRFPRARKATNSSAMSPSTKSRRNAVRSRPFPAASAR